MHYAHDKMHGFPAIYPTSSTICSTLTQPFSLISLECVAVTPPGIMTDRTHVHADPHPADHSAFPPASTFPDTLEKTHEVYLTSLQPALTQPGSSQAQLIIFSAVLLLFYSCEPRSFCSLNNWNVSLYFYSASGCNHTLFSLVMQ